MIDNIAEVCGLLQYTPHLEEIVMYSTHSHNTTAVAEPGVTTFSRFGSMRLIGYNIFSSVIN